MKVNNPPSLPALPDRTQKQGFNSTYFDRQWAYLTKAIRQTSDSIQQVAGEVTTIQNTPTPTPGGSLVNNSNGTARTNADGSVDQWGITVAAVPTGGVQATLAVPFAVPFASIPVITGCFPDNHADGSGNNPLSCYPTAVTKTGFIANLSCGILVGGSGAAGISNVIHIQWSASL